MKNILSIDLESWVHFYIDAMRLKKPICSAERKVLDNGYCFFATNKLLDILDAYRQTATFFVVAEIYDWYPEIIKEIQRRGHEIGYHTYDHALLTSHKILEEQLKKSGKFLRDFHPFGFRAPQILLTRDSMSVLKENGFKYSSSTYDENGLQSANGLDEIPVSTVMWRGRSKGPTDDMPKKLTIGLFSKKLPFGSGLFVALLGKQIFRFIDAFNKRNIPAIIFIHPWQVYKTRSIEGLGFIFKILWRNPLCLPYAKNISRTLEKILKKYQFVSFKEYYYGQQELLG